MLTGAAISFIGTIVGATGKSINQSETSFRGNLLGCWKLTSVLVIASGVIFGLGSGIQEMSYACIQEIMPNRYRIYAIGMIYSRRKESIYQQLIMIGAFDALASISFLGPLVAYAFIGKTEIGWRGAYWYFNKYTFPPNEEP